MKLRPRLYIQMSNFPKLHAAVHPMHEREVGSVILNLAEEALRMREMLVVLTPTPEALSTSPHSKMEANSSSAVQSAALDMVDSTIRTDLMQASREKSRATRLWKKIATSRHR
jgi:hypothetical protein